MLTYINLLKRFFLCAFILPISAASKRSILDRFLPYFNAAESNYFPRRSYDSFFFQYCSIFTALMLCTSLLHGAASRESQKKLSRERFSKPRALALKVAICKSHVQEPIIEALPALSALSLSSSSSSIPELQSEGYSASSSSRQPAEEDADKLIGKIHASSSAQLITPEMLRSSLTVPLERVTKADIWNITNRLGMKLDMTEELCEGISSRIAHDLYIHIEMGPKRLSADQAFLRLSPFLQSHFKGVSIKEFLDYNFPKLTEARFGPGVVMDLSDFCIGDLTGFESISDIKNLESLILTRNRITTITLDAFIHFANLSQLFLDSNHITTIYSDAFTPLAKLETLYLHDNELAVIPPSTFTPLTNLQMLYLYNNQLSEVEQQRIKAEVEKASLYAEIYF